MPDKLRDSAAACFEGLKEQGILRDGMTVHVGGFGLCGIPEQLIIALRDTGVKDLTCVSNNAGVDDWGLGLLLQTKQIAKMVSSYVGENETFEKQYLDGELQVEFNPQGTLAERIRAGGAGIPAFYTATGFGTKVAEGKETRKLMAPDQSGERDYVMETGIFADLALVKAHQADPFGNLTYRMTARNFNPMMAAAARVTLAEVDELLDAPLDPEHVHTPGNYIDRVVRTVAEKRIEQRTVRQG